MKKYQSIAGYKELIRHVKDSTYYVGKDADGNAIFDKTRDLPTIRFQGTVKSHGTNAGVRYDVDSDKITFQSRERELTIESDNAGFCLWGNMPPVKECFVNTFDYLLNDSGIDFTDALVESIVIFGEWCASNIQKGVAITGLPKMYLLFEVQYHLTDGTIYRYTPRELDLVCMDEYIMQEFHDLNIYDISDFGIYEIDIDFNHPELSQNKLVELTESVEHECPIGKHFGRVLGQDNTTGEGIVWRGIVDDHTKLYQMKVKGEKHANSKVKTIAPVDTEKFAKVSEFVENFVTEARLNQGIAYLKEMNLDVSPKSMGAFIKWINSDIFKECSDSIIESQLDAKMIANHAAVIARKFLLNYIEE